MGRFVKGSWVAPPSRRKVRGDSAYYRAIVSKRFIYSLSLITKNGAVLPLTRYRDLAVPLRYLAKNGTEGRQLECVGKGVAEVVVSGETAVVTWPGEAPLTVHFALGACRECGAPSDRHGGRAVRLCAGCAAAHDPAS